MGTGFVPHLGVHLLCPPAQVVRDALGSPSCLYLQSYWQGNTARQNEHRLQNVDPQSSCRSLGALAVQLYQQLIRTAEKQLKPMIGTAGERW